MTRIAALSDVHGNALALEAVLSDIDRARPDVVMVAGDLVLNGPDPAMVVDVLRRLADDGALVIAGNTDIAVADSDYAAAFPWLQDGVPDAMIAAAEWAHDALGPERVDWLRRLPAERRCRADDDTLVLTCHAFGNHGFLLSPSLAAWLPLFVFIPTAYSLSGVFRS